MLLLISCKTCQVHRHRSLSEGQRERVSERQTETDRDSQREGERDEGAEEEGKKQRGLLTFP